MVKTVKTVKNMNKLYVVYKKCLKKYKTVKLNIFLNIPVLYILLTIQVNHDLFIIL